MTGSRRTIRRKLIWRVARFVCVPVLAVAVLAPLPLSQAASVAISRLWSALSHTSPQQEDELQEKPTQKPSSNYVPRIKLVVGNTHELNFAEAILAVTVLDQNVAAAETKDNRSIRITGLNAGETILIISGKNSRNTYVIQVVRPPRAVHPKGNDAQQSEPTDSFSGFYGLHFSPGLDGAPSLLHHDFEFKQNLPHSRALHASGEMFNLFGRGNHTLAQPLGTNFGVNRIKLGLDSPESRFDLLDSELEISRLSFNNYTMRGPHFVSKSDSRLKGLEIFAGRARPQSSLFNDGEGWLAGVLVPLAQAPSWRIRAGAFFISPQHHSPGRDSGIVWQGDARYAPNENTRAEAEVAYAHGGLSWRTSLELRRGPFNFHSELLKLDEHSPLIGLGAQSSGRNMKSFGLQWRPHPRFGISLGYNNTTTSPPSTARRIELNSRTMNATVSYIPARGARLSFSFNQQEIETPTTLSLPFLLKLQTRTATFKYAQRIASHVSNDFEARFIQSREDNTSEQMTSGVSLREQLRYSWRRGSIAGFVNYRSNTPSLAGLIVRNPALLPVELRSAFAADPARFLLNARDELKQFLSGVELPITHSTETGLRLQAAFSRLNLASEVRYSIGEILARNERNLLATLSADLKLDAANSVQVSGTRDFSFSGAGNRTALTVSYVHRFGSASGGGFQFSKLLGLSRGSIQGRVFSDLNGNGQDDPEEPGVAGMKIELDGNHTLTTDLNGRFSFNSLESGEHTVALASEELGVRLRASNTTLRQIFLPGRETINVSFGVINFGFAQGRIFNDLFLSGEMSAGDAPGVTGVRVILHPALTEIANAVQPLPETVNASGTYEFRNLPPGSYVLEIDPASIPADFRPTGQMAWPIRINPLQGSYTDIPLVAQRAISGLVFIDRDGNGQFDSKTDEVVKGARVVAGRAEAWTDHQGSYILRNLPAGKIEVCAFLPNGRKSKTITIELDSNPTFRKNVGLAIKE
jgi:hypothetical protein